MDYLILLVVVKVMVLFRDYYCFKGLKWFWVWDCILVLDFMVELVILEDLGLIGMRLNLWVFYSYRLCKFKIKLKFEFIFYFKFCKKKYFEIIREFREERIFLEGCY